MKNDSLTAEQEIELKNLLYTFLKNTHIESISDRTIRELYCKFTFKFGNPAWLILRIPDLLFYEHVRSLIIKEFLRKAA